MKADWLGRQWTLLNPSQLQDYLHAARFHTFAQMEKVNLRDMGNKGAEHIHLLQKMIEERGTNKARDGPADLAEQILVKQLTTLLLASRLICREIAEVELKPKRSKTGQAPVTQVRKKIKIPGLDLPKNFPGLLVDSNFKKLAKLISKNLNKFLGEDDLFENEVNFVKDGKNKVLI